MSKYLLLISKSNEHMHHMCSIDEWNNLSPEDHENYTKVTVENDPPQYDVFNEMAIVGDIKELILNINTETNSVKADWKIIPVQSHVKIERINQYNHIMIKNYSDAFIKFLNQQRNTYLYTTRSKVGDKHYELLMDLEMIYNEFQNRNLRYPFVFPVNELIKMESPDIIDPIEPDKQQFMRIPGYIEFDGFAMQQLMFEYKKKIKEAYADFGKRIKEDHISNYADLIRHYKVNTQQ